MKPWTTRSTEEANLFNPAFLAVIIYQSVKGYCETARPSAPYVLPFLVTPLVLHKKTRETLPRGVNTAFSTWITQFQGAQAKIGYPERARSIVPYVKEALAFTLTNQLITSNDDGSLNINHNIRVPSRSNDNVTTEVVKCFQKAHFCGRWFARAGKIETVMALLGIKP